MIKLSLKCQRWLIIIPLIEKMIIQVLQQTDLWISYLSEMFK